MGLLKIHFYWSKIVSTVFRRDEARQQNTHKITQVEFDKYCH